LEKIRHSILKDVNVNLTAQRRSSIANYPNIPR